MSGQSDAEGVLDYDRAAADGMYKERMKDGIHIATDFIPIQRVDSSWRRRLTG